MNTLTRRIFAVLLLSSLCWAGQATAEDRVFDHASTGFDLVGPHAVTACESCHLSGQFTGTPRRCEGCHKLNGSVSATHKPPNHIIATDQCDACHQEITWKGVVLIDHTQVIGTCRQCHNNAIAPGQVFNHIPTGASECDECHSDMSWQPVAFTHPDSTAECQSCHNNVNVSGKPPGHIPTVEPARCNGCHQNTLSWAPVLSGVDHDLVLEGTCIICHGDGGFAPGQDADHIETGTTDCSVCHNKVSFDNTVAF